MQALRAANVRLPAGEFASANEVFLVTVGAPIRSARRRGRRGRRQPRRRRCTCGTWPPCVEAPAEATDYVTHAARGEGGAQAVTIAVAKRPGVNATDIAHAALARVDEARSRLLPADVPVDVTRNYGETASEKAERADAAPAHRHALRHGADRALPRLARGAGGAGGGAGHARADALRVLRAGLHAQPHHAVRADLLDRHPGGRRHRGGREHLPPPRRWATARPTWPRSRGWTRSATRPSSPPSPSSRPSCRWPSSRG